MADTSGMNLIRGIDIDKLAKGFAEEEYIFKQYCAVTATPAREIRWYQKPQGVLTATSPASLYSDQLALPTILEQSWTRQTSYVQKFIVESPIISMEDIKDCDPDVLGTNVRDITRAVTSVVDSAIWDIMTESRSPTTINMVHVNAAWDTASWTNVDIIEDIMDAKLQIRTYGYNPEGAVLFLNGQDHKALLTWLISSKGSSIPNWSSSKVETGVVMEFLGLRVVVSNNVTSDYACVVIPQRACSYKEFTSMTAVQIPEPGIGTKVRVWTEGIAMLTDPKAVCLISGTKA